MLFNSLKFLLIFPTIFIIYWGIPLRWQTIKKCFLIVVSYGLYMNWKPAFAIALLAVTAITYGGGYLLDKQQTGNRKTLCWCFTLLGLLPLLIFKYYNFINETLSQTLSAIGLRFELPGLNWAVPVGISFFTFQAVGYLLDVYHHRIAAEKNIADYILFVSFFPQIASGPISKASELLPQIKNQHSFNYTQAVSGLKYLLWGMFLKVVLADRIDIYVNVVFSHYKNFSGLGCLIGNILYCIQVYADFAGYSLMAIGIGKTLGFNLINNFRRPYFSTSITEFWRRWHISLSRWLKDYVYVPLGGNRCSKTRNYWNIFVTFLVSGIWHGANWTFILWGVFHGICQIIEKIFGWNKKQYTGIAKFGRVLLTFFLVTLSWIIFRSPSIGDALGFISRYGSMTGQLLADKSTMAYILMAFIPLAVHDILSEFKPEPYSRWMAKPFLRWFAYVSLFCMILLLGRLDGSSFIYANF